MTLDELERYEEARAGLRDRDCHCTACDDLAWALDYIGQSKELTWARTEAEYQANHKEEAVPDNDYGNCADCNTQAQVNRLYTIMAPVDAREPRHFFLCQKCWDNIIGAAVYQAMR